MASPAAADRSRLARAWHALQVTEETLDDYQTSFRGSDQERTELLELYQRMNGDMKKVMEWLPCSEPAVDSHRFMDALDAAIEEGDIKSTEAYRKWCKKVLRTRRPSDPLKSGRRGAGDAAADDALVRAIQSRVRGRTT